MSTNFEELEGVSVTDSAEDGDEASYETQARFFMDIIMETSLR